MREWTGFVSHEPRQMAEALNRYLREVSAAFKRVNNGQAPTGGGGSLTLADPPPARQVETATKTVGTGVPKVGEFELLAGSAAQD